MQALTVFLKENYIPILIFAGTFIVLKFFKYYAISKLRKLAESTKNDIDDLLTDIMRGVGEPFYVVIPIYATSLYLNLSNILTQVINKTALITVIFYSAKALQEITTYAVKKALTKDKENGETEIDPSILRNIKTFIHFALWIVAFLVLLQNFGFDITTLIAGLGIGGIAIAFALQNVLGDIFASISIYIDRPFETGDYITIGGDGGTVNHIGLKSTRLTTLRGEELIISNKELTESRINNFKKMEQRRVNFMFGVTCETEIEHLKRIPEMIREILNADDMTTLDRVHFKEIGDYSFNYEVVYSVNSQEYAVYMDTQQRINIELLRRLKDMGVELAYPAQNIFVKNNS